MTKKHQEVVKFTSKGENFLVSFVGALKESLENNQKFFKKC
jgi:hypothetical protein